MNCSFPTAVVQLLQTGVLQPQMGSWVSRVLADRAAVAVSFAESDWFGSARYRIQAPGVSL